jgi:hypothetical protein
LGFQVKAALRANFVINTLDLPDSVSQQFSGDSRYMWVKLPQSFHQDGKEYQYIVAPFKLIDGLKFEQKGAGVLCQTEDETKETFNALIAREKKHLVSFHAAGIGGVGWMFNLRRLVNEIGVMFKNLSGGKTIWLAYERETDQDTLEVTTIRRKETNNEGEANFWARTWLDEFNKEKKSHFDSISQIVTPPPPIHCTALTPREIEDLGNAKIIAIQRQWPRCFEIFKHQKSNPNLKIADQEIEDAYLLDLVANGGNPFPKDGKIRFDMELISALHKAAQNYARRGKGKIVDAAIYMIAFNWENGWCYFSDQQLAEKLTQLLETSFTAEQVKKYRLNILGLVAKHKPGLPPKSI